VGYRLSRITTRTGDRGTTGLASGERVSKDHPRILALGAVDELNSWIGLVLAQAPPSEIGESLGEIQHQLFEVGAELSLPARHAITAEHVAALEAAVVKFNARLAPLEEFVLPGGSQAAALCHVARTVCRRAETRIVALRAAEPVEDDRLVPYLNRLSDLLFVLARLLNRESAREETLWRSERHERR
jgi:cob(I)alamin adenosyltransferase